VHKKLTSAELQDIINQGQRTRAALDKLMRGLKEIGNMLANPDCRAEMKAELDELDNTTRLQHAAELGRCVQELVLLHLEILQAIETPKSKPRG
jgi:hypothetical protein